MDRQIRVKTPAKLNLTLAILGRREDGFHEVETVMQSISICDELTLRLRREAGITLSSALPFLPLDNRNLAYRAALAFFEAAGIRDFGLEIHLQKRIPVGAGLGGGSANAAGALIGLNRLYQTHFTPAQLADIGRPLGADVPFCILQGTCLGTGLGDQLVRLPDLPRCTFVVAKPRKSLSTAALYALYDRAGQDEPRPDSGALIRALGGPLHKLAACCGNALQSAAIREVPQIGELLEALTGEDALCAVMTGSGSAVYGMFAGNGAARSCVARMRARFPGCFVSLAAPTRAGAFSRRTAPRPE
ncbi:MAG: 4-(cytidine 5'-diphospho)-2-C-methyl-D-erythritol kinase [Clostridiales bacterium]|nr:4-(cytidine 5'-diphospho)-2-C-methyl-D-erythritol kinase [Clostridiales bacterium]